MGPELEGSPLNLELLVIARKYLKKRVLKCWRGDLMFKPGYHEIISLFFIVVKL